MKANNRLIFRGHTSYSRHICFLLQCSSLLVAAARSKVEVNLQASGYREDKLEKQGSIENKINLAVGVHYSTTEKKNKNANKPRKEKSIYNSCSASFFYKHWEYQSFWYLQVEPETHLVGPSYPIPPQRPHLGTSV